MEELLQELMNSLYQIGEQHSELYDTMVRESLCNALYAGFVLQRRDYQVGDSFGLYSDEANQKVKQVLTTYLTAALQHPEARAVTDEVKRKKMVWNYEVSSKSGYRPDDFFGAI